ncbi:MAG: hypothetical protein LBQ52_00275 [Helicobacteraceae bacterium]|nr:hypothetical protein [Helicobacteraceae bacterium]
MRKFLSALFAFGLLFAGNLAASEVAICYADGWGDIGDPSQKVTCNGDKLSGRMAFKDVFAKGWTLAGVQANTKIAVVRSGSDPQLITNFLFIFAK